MIQDDGCVLRPGLGRWEDSGAAWNDYCDGEQPLGPPSNGLAGSRSDI